MKLTKIVATIGPASDSEEMIAELLSAGVNVFRFNTKHGTREWHESRIKRVQRTANSLNKTVGILLDLQGPEIRLETNDKLPFSVSKGEIVNITPSFTKDIESVCIPHELVFRSLKKGDQILIDDGEVELIVQSVSDRLIKTESQTEGTIGHRKGVNFPGVKMDLPSLIDEDLKNLDLASINKVDFIALSFTRTKRDINILKAQMEKRDLKAMVVAKIESKEALDNLDDLIETADAIMVARGDLGVEVPIEQLAFWQKSIIKKCRLANKPVITATQMLDSMMFNPRPTRAEATDVANAVLDGTDALMLSGETASGKYPLKAVQAMTRIATFNEKDHATLVDLKPGNQTDVIVKAVGQMIDQESLKVNMILVFTHSGETARSISRLRLGLPIVAATADQRVVEQLTMSYGTFAIKTRFAEKDFKLPNPVIEMLINKKMVDKGDNLIVVHGQHYYEKATTNAVALIKI